jgi:hypothetical protein
MFTGRFSTADWKPLEDFCQPVFSELVYEKRSIKGCSHVAQNHNTNIKIVSEFTEDMKKFCLEIEQKFSTENLCIVHEKSWWQHEK